MAVPVGPPAAQRRPGGYYYNYYHEILLVFMIVAGRLQHKDVLAVVVGRHGHGGAGQGGVEVHIGEEAQPPDRLLP